ncbi:hypothetical protein [Nonomuraea africana]|uniref:hypothetical protein n=1 Tax=Nonomuraea africana TaxID=46171 RepID=UPI00178A26CE|nr:hypothetical protein [Nonomuraea africana]
MRPSVAFALAVVVLASTGCSSIEGTATAKPPAASGQCPVTLPSTPDPSAKTPGDFFGRENSYGNGKLWVGGLAPKGVIEADASFIQPDGWIHQKFGWWRASAGDLKITGRRLDGPAAPARSEVPEGYGDTGFQATGVYFPVAGCWEITGRVGPDSLTFVTSVIKTAR